MTVRPAQTTDRDRLADLLERVDTFTREEVECALELVDLALTPGNSDYAVRVAEHDGALTGYVCYGPTPMTDGTFDWYWAATDPNARRQGVCVALVAAMEEDLRARGGRLIRVETSSLPAYAPARSLFARLGYAEAARLPDFYEVGHDLCIQLKRL